MGDYCIIKLIKLNKCLTETMMHLCHDPRIMFNPILDKKKKTTFCPFLIIHC